MGKPRLLPAQIYQAGLLWPDETLDIACDKYRSFLIEVKSRVKINPAMPQAGLDPLTFTIVSTLISVGLQALSALIWKPQAPGSGNGGLRARTVTGASFSGAQRFAPQFGFDSVQQPATLGATVPLVFAHRRDLPAQSVPPRPAGSYGGLRVNLPLLWSQMLSLNGGQVFRGIFMVGEGTISSLDPNGFAVGDNSLSSYGMSTDSATQSSSRMTIYFSPGGGRIGTANRIAGRSGSNDPVNSQRFGGPDVYAVRGQNYQWTQDFCYTYKPSTSTSFGLYSHIPNNFAYRVNPRLNPTISIRTVSLSNGQSVRYAIDDDAQRLAEFWKYKYSFSCRSGIVTSAAGTVDSYVGQTFEYTLSPSSDIYTQFKMNSTNTDNKESEADGIADCSDIASAVSSIQRSIDDSLVVGEIYRVGSALAVLVNRIPSNQVFSSEADTFPSGTGSGMTYTFRTVRAGKFTTSTALDINPSWSGQTLLPTQFSPGQDVATINAPKFKTASNFAQIFRIAIANVMLQRPAKIFEIGFKYSVGLKINGFCNFRDCPTLLKINKEAGYKHKNNIYDADKKVSVQQFNSGTISGLSETRYFFYKIYYRHENNSYTAMPMTFAFRGSSGEPIYSYLRFEASLSKRWELKFEPVSSWEIRNDYDGIVSPFIIIDSKISTVNSWGFTAGGATFYVYWQGEIVSRDRSVFSLPTLDPAQDVGLGFTDDQSMTDDWGRVAEAFAYSEIQSTASAGPEAEIAYINIISCNPTTVSYSNLATVGLNIMGSRDLSQISQLSASVDGGTEVRRLRDGDTMGPSDVWPDVFRACQTSEQFGLGDIITDAYIDIESYITAANWCHDRRYFYDAGIPEAVNLDEWSVDTAATMLLDIIRRGGKWALEPAIVFPESGALPISGLFNGGNIVENTFSLSFIEQEGREEIEVSVMWRRERPTSDYYSSGFFSENQTVTVREASNLGKSLKTENVDVSEYCTNFEHAVDIACFMIRMRRLITHSIKFTTTAEGIDAELAAGKYIKVAMDFTYFDEFATGVVLADGTMVATRTDLLTAGTHDVTAWDGSEADLYDTTLTVSGSGTASPTGITFVKKTAGSQVRVYRIEKIDINEDGEIEISAINHPVDESGISMIGKNWTTYITDSNWIIQGTGDNC
jgi:hypothetical protein